MCKSKHGRWHSVHRRFWVVAPLVLALELMISSSHAQQLCMTLCGTRQVPCADVNTLLCGVFIGAVDIQVPDPLSQGGLLTITTIDLGLVLDDYGPGPGDWRGYVLPDKSVVFPIVSTPPPRGPDVTGSNQNRQCGFGATTCLLTSQYFSTTVIPGTSVTRQFVLQINRIDYQDGTPIPRALVGTYSETIDNYTLGRTIVVNGTFRVERQVPISPVMP
jgi:hypothetical protein